MSERVLIYGMGVALQAPLTIFGKQHFDIQIAEEGLVGDIIIAITHITIDKQSINRLQLELRLVFLAGTRSFSFGTNRHTNGEDIGQFGQPCIDLAGNRGG